MSTVYLRFSRIVGRERSYGFGCVFVRVRIYVYLYIYRREGVRVGGRYK